MSFGRFYILLSIICIILSYNFSFAQKDTLSLLSEWNNQKLKPDFTSDTTSVLLLQQLAEQYMFDQPDSALVFCEEALKLAQQQGYKIGEMKVLYVLGKAYYIKGSYNMALENNFKALELSKELKDKAGYVRGLNTIGLVYIGQHNYSAALKELFNAAELNIALKDSAQLIKNYFNIGLCYDETSNYDSAIFYVKKVILIAKKIRDYRMIVMSHNRLGEIYFHMKKYTEALAYYQRVLQDTSYRSKWENSFAYAGTGQTYYALGKYQQCVNNALKGYEFARDMHAKWDMERALRILSDGYAALGNFGQAYHYHTLYKAYSDSLYSEAKEREINFLHLQQKEAENQQLARENQLQQQENRLSKLIIIIISIVSLFFIIAASFIYRNNRQKHQLNKLLIERNADIASQKEKIAEQNEELSALNNTKDQLFSVISHDLKSPFASIMGTFELIGEGLLDTREQKMVLKELHRKVSSVSEMLNNLLYWANSQQKGISAVFLKVNLPVVVDSILAVSNILAHEKKVCIQHASDRSKFIYADPDHVKIILQNIIGNAIKFTPAGRDIHLFYSEDDTYFAVHVKDSGVGIPSDKLDKIFVETGQSISSRGTNREKGTGIGLMLVKQFVHGNNGKLEVRSKPGEGSEFVVYFKKYIGQKVMGELEAYSKSG
ncbi:signal transduction histidine kinase [Catalinimonas alkaloidigena]|uniref:tetratricopeptide repeat-containing sensor histidine kinase n=1 Tax=Catalinimonas alkaloidigena TaxID=1075417 RepID=UPI002405A286|nr:ATP-binding protein [Catalinimonas alkaloidigena]MDF9799929.1 signal transduction histidine kinase [Catalinimonas alkaloidigena]